MTTFVRNILDQTLEVILLLRFVNWVKKKFVRDKLCMNGWTDRHAGQNSDVDIEDGYLFGHVLGEKFRYLFFCSNFFFILLGPL